jgi:HNH endonuclease
MAAHHPIVQGVRFKDIPGCTGYCVGDDGSVWSSKPRPRARDRTPRPWRRLALTPEERSGHLQVSFNNDSGKRVYFRVHRLVLEAFKGPCPIGMEGCHDPDPDPSNNRIENLRWDTHEANNHDTVRHGRLCQGERNHLSKLMEIEVIEIRRLAGLKVIHEIIAARFGVSRQTVGDVVNRKTWRFLG